MPDWKRVNLTLGNASARHLRFRLQYDAMLLRLAYLASDVLHLRDDVVVNEQLFYRPTCTGFVGTKAMMAAISLFAASKSGTPSFVV